MQNAWALLPTKVKIIKNMIKNTYLETQRMSLLWGDYSKNDEATIRKSFFKNKLFDLNLFRLIFQYFSLKNTTVNLFLITHFPSTQELLEEYQNTYLLVCVPPSPHSFTLFAQHNQLSSMQEEKHRQNNMLESPPNKFRKITGTSPPLIQENGLYYIHSKYKNGFVTHKFHDENTISTLQQLVRIRNPAPIEYADLKNLLITFEETCDFEVQDKHNPNTQGV